MRVDFSLIGGSAAKLLEYFRTKGKKNGRIIACTDSAKFYYEFNGKRYKVNSTEFVTSANDIGNDLLADTTTLYIDANGNMYIWNGSAPVRLPGTGPDSVVVDNAQLFGSVSEKSFADSTWAEIFQVADSGKAPLVYKLGESKQVGEWTVQIIGFNADPETHITFRAYPTYLNKSVKLLASANYSEDNSIDDMYESPLMDAIEAAGATIESAIGAGSGRIKAVEKLYYTSVGNPVYHTSKFFPFSLSETQPASGIVGTCAVYGADGTIYDYFAQSKLQTEPYWAWWTRTLCPHTSIPGIQISCVAQGTIGLLGGEQSSGVVFGFCI